MFHLAKKFGLCGFLFGMTTFCHATLPYKGKCDCTLRVIKVILIKVTLMTHKVQSHLSLLCIISYCYSNMNLHDLEFLLRV